MIRHSPALHLIWQIADMEAENLNQPMIRPAHFFLALLKSVDLDLEKSLKRVDTETSTEIKRDCLKLKNCVTEFILDPTQTRRFLRGILPKGEKKNSSEKRRRRTSLSKEVFKKAENDTQDRKGVVTPLHLLLALLECDEPQIRTILDKVDVDLDDFKKYLVAQIKNRTI